MINYTERLTLLMQDIVTRVPALSFLNMADVLVFARQGRSNAEGAVATCHCLTLPPSDPGYYFWRDRQSGEITRRSEWFVTRSPHVTVGPRSIKYMVSFSVPRFCDQSLERSRKGQFYRGACAPLWLAKLDTVVHELYHIDPDLAGIRRIEREDGTVSSSCHGPDFFQQVATLVQTYLDSRPSPEAYDFLSHDFSALDERFGGVVATAFRTFPSFPQRYSERLAVQLPCEADRDGVRVEPLKAPRQPIRYAEDDLHIRQFTRTASRRLIRKGAFRAA